MASTAERVKFQFSSSGTEGLIQNLFPAISSLGVTSFRVSSSHASCSEFPEWPWLTLLLGHSAPIKLPTHLSRLSLSLKTTAKEAFPLSPEKTELTGSLLCLHCMPCSALLSQNLLHREVTTLRYFYNQTSTFQHKLEGRRQL